MASMTPVPLDAKTLSGRPVGSAASLSFGSSFGNILKVAFELKNMVCEDLNVEVNRSYSCLPLIWY